MRVTTVCGIFTILVSLALAIFGFPENTGRDNSLTTLNLAPASVDGRNLIPIYNPALAFERDENHRAKRHLFKKKKGKKGYQQQQSPPVIIINQYGPAHGGSKGGGWSQPIRQPQPVHVPNYGWRR